MKIKCNPIYPGQNMHIERRIINDSIELWECEWEYDNHGNSVKKWLRRIGIEQPVKTLNHESANAICWSYGRTLGNIAVFNQTVLGTFPGAEGSNANLACDFVDAGKFRHGKERWWCRTHQCHWGTKADIAAAHSSGEMICANHDQAMCYVTSPYELDLSKYAEIGIWCSLPAAITSSGHVPQRPPKIHLHVREHENGPKIIDGDFNAISLIYSPSSGLFGSEQITRVHLTPPAAFEFLKGVLNNIHMDCVNCSHCGYPHLDLGSFASIPHRKHFCGNCGRDSTWSKMAIASTPLKPIHDQFSSASKFITPESHINIDDYSDCKFIIWASTPAIVWTGNRPQQQGIHVHINKNGKRIVDETFGEVTYKGERIIRDELVNLMLSRTIV
jgi:hypothetical protein